MILGAKNIKPFIHLGFSKQSIEAPVDSDIVVWQDKLYNDYSVTFENLDGTYVLLGVNKSILNFSTTGEKTIKLVATSKDKKTYLESNEVIINVI